MDVAVEKVDGRVVMAENQNVRFLAGMDLFGQLLPSVRESVGAAAIRVDKANLDPAQNQVALILTEINHVRPLVGNQRANIDTRPVPPAKAVIASDEIGSDAGNLWVMLDNIVGLSYRAKGVNLVLLAAVDTPAGNDVARVHDVLDSLLLANRVEGVELVEPLVNRAGVSVGNNSEGKPLLRNLLANDLGVRPPPRKNPRKLSLCDSELFENFIAHLRPLLRFGFCIGFFSLAFAIAVVLHLSTIATK